MSNQNGLSSHGGAARSASAHFTLIELLVVIGIIAILASILLPSLNQAKKSVRGIECVSRIKAFGTFAGMYAFDFNGYYVHPAYTGKTDSTDGILNAQTDFWPQNHTEWTSYMLMNYYKAPRKFTMAEMATPSVLPRQIRKAVLCPDLPKKLDDAGAFNWALNIRAVSLWNAPKLVHIYRQGEQKMPSKTAYFIESKSHYMWEINGNISSDYPEFTRHNGKISLFFIDGHAEGRSLKNLLRCHPINGKNCYFARAQLDSTKTYYNGLD